jgi:hypothetical protein
MLRPLTAARMASAERRPQCAAERPLHRICTKKASAEGVGVSAPCVPSWSSSAKPVSATKTSRNISMKRPTNCSSFAGTLRG